MSKTELKTFSPEANSFEANGKKYLIHGSISVGRYKHYEALQAQMAWGVDFERMYKDLERVWALLNQTKLAEASVQINNMREGVARNLEKRQHPALMLCTLFICREGEDLSAWNETEAMDKVADWVAEGYEMASFFKYAFSLVRGLEAAWAALLSDTSGQREGEPGKTAAVQN